MTTKSLTHLYQYFDHLFDENASADTLFASSYVRGFIAVEAVNFGDDEQTLTAQLYQQVNDKINAAKAELSPQDRAFVTGFYQKLSIFFSNS